VLVGNPDEIAAAAEDIGFNIRGAEIIDPENFDGMDEMVDEMVALRKGKMTADECRAALKKSNYFGTMLVKMGKADCLLGGATYSTADTVRPALQLIKTKPGNKIVSSCFIMVRPAASGENEVLAMADCAINIKPNEDELVEICKETVSCAKIFGVDPKVAFLSYSTLGSGKGEDVDKMRNACEKAKALMPDTPIGGEFQFDAAVSPAVAKTKHITDAVGGHANTFIFPDINAGNLPNFARLVKKTGFTKANSGEQWYSDMFLENASFFRMDDINLGYTFNKIGNWKGSMRVAFGVQNVFVITDYSGVDPEIPGVNGIDGSIWPRPRTYSLRLNVNF
jgi:phosphate acetyltransferase